MTRKLYGINMRALLAGILQLRQKKGGLAKRVALCLMMAFILLSLMLTFGSLFYIMHGPIFDAGLEWFYFALQAVMSFILSVFGTIFSAQTLFASKDNELLLSMPIKPHKILLSRLLVLLTFEYVFEALTAIPAAVVWCAMGAPTLNAGLLFAAGCVFLPLMSLSVSCFAGWALSLLFSRFRNSSFISLLFSAGILALYIYLYSRLQIYINALLSQGVEIAEAFRRALPPFYAFGAGIANESAIDFLVFALWAVAPFVFTAAVMSGNYQKILTEKKGSAKAVYREKGAKASSAGFALFKKEMAYYFSKPMVVMNTSSGSIIFLIIAVAVIVKKGEFTNYLNNINTLGIESMPVLAAAALAGMAGMNNLTASLISLEGKYLWIAKSIPADPKIILLSKIYAHLAASGIPCFAASVPVSFLATQSTAGRLLILVFPQAFIFLTAEAGLALNLIFPRFDWASEVQPVKHGAPAMIMAFGSMGVMAALMVAYVAAIGRHVGAMQFMWALTAAFAGASLLVWLWLAKFGAKRLSEL